MHFGLSLALGSVPTMTRSSSGGAGDTAIYVAASGNDANDGSQASPKATIAAAVSASSGAIRLNRGDVWREMLTAVAGLSVGAYGTGDDPVISGANVVSGLTMGASRVWSGTFSTEPSQVFVDGERGERVATSGAASSYRKWHWASNTLTVYGPVGGGAPVVEASVRAAAIDCNGADGVTIDGIRAERGLVCIDGDGCNSLTIRNSVVADAFVEGILNNAEGGETISGLVIEDSEISGCGGTGIQFNLKHSGVTIARNTIHHCCQLHHELTGANARHQWSAGIKWWGDELNDQFLDVLIEDNDLYDLMPQFSVGAEPGGRGVGIWGDHYYYATPPASPEVVVRGNVVVRCQGWGLYGEKTEATLFEDNAALDPAYGADGTGTTQFVAGAALASNEAPAGDCLDSEIAHCTVIGGWWGIAFNNSSTASALSNCTIRDSIAVGAYQPSGPWDGENFYASTQVNAGGAFGSGNVVQNLNLGPDRSAMARWSGTAYATAEAFDTAQTAVSGMVSGDPLFADTGAGDYRLGVGSPCIGAATDSGDLGASSAVLLRLAAIPAAEVTAVSITPLSGQAGATEFTVSGGSGAIQWYRDAAGTDAIPGATSATYTSDGTFGTTGLTVRRGGVLCEAPALLRWIGYVSTEGNNNTSAVSVDSGSVMEGQRYFLVATGDTPSGNVTIEGVGPSTLTTHADYKQNTGAVAGRTTYVFSNTSADQIFNYQFSAGWGSGWRVNHLFKAVGYDVSPGTIAAAGQGTNNTTSSTAVVNVAHDLGGVIAVCMEYEFLANPTGIQLFSGSTFQKATSNDFAAAGVGYLATANATLGVVASTDASQGNKHVCAIPLVPLQP